MIKKLLLLNFMLFALLSKAQNVLLIENTEENRSLFNDQSPYSLFSLLKNNLGILGYYELKGLDNEKVSLLRENNDVLDLLSFVFPDTTGLPLIGVNGIDSIQTIDGMDYYVYPAPDTIYADLDGIRAITLEFNGNSHKLENITRINFWKRYPGDEMLTCSFSANAKELLKLDAFKQVVKIGDSLAGEISNLEDPNSMWSVMKDSALSDMLFQSALAEESEINIGIYNYQQFILPTVGEFYWNSIRLRLSNYVYRLGVMNKLQTYCEEDNPIDKMPFVILDSARFRGSENYSIVMKELDSCYFVKYQPKSAFIEDDPSSENFGMEKIFVNEEGDSVLMYPEAEFINFWIDFKNPVIYVTEDLVYDEALNSTKTRIEQVYLTKTIDAPTLISYFPLPDEFSKYFTSHQVVTIENQPWRLLLNEMVKGRKNHFKLKRRCQRKKFQKRLNK